MKTTIQMTGLRELGLAMKELDSRLQKKMGRNAVAAGARVIQKQAKQNAPLLKEPASNRKRGTIKKQIRSKAERKKNGIFEARVWVKGIGKKKVQEFKTATGQNSSQNPNDPFYWWMVELGTAKTPPQPFMRPAFGAKKVQAAEKIKSNLADRIDKEAKQIGQTIGKANKK
ncbi:HK97-gp10 family putative phage morphogenesis protein [Allopusillimonas ginsengisoli]|uniref:HK97-gp10 family putative phage morphogenesis protein n=1 Tax=Allopusillimonas ginsengisoli TaxID=453575 RepID=UPI00101EF3C1|nr:HK97-gp10 family putative phage morphogenesis protein [Allopusillimonas ginsengisoli]TEA79834.1 hypothetical protein ERE07_02525 [Allopusillimonas ginsengisoli]